MYIRICMYEYMYSIYMFLYICIGILWMMTRLHLLKRTLHIRNSLHGFIYISILRSLADATEM